MLENRCIDFCATPFQLCFNAGHWRCINIVQHLKPYVGFRFIFNVISTLKQYWSDVDMLADISNVTNIN